MKVNPHHKATVALADDHVLLRNGLARLIDSFEDYAVIFEADNGLDLQEKVAKHGAPDLMLMDINMPKMDGFAAAEWLKQTHPLTRILALSMYDQENSVIRMFKAGAKGYILKDCEPPELMAALDSVMKKGYYYSELVTGKLIHSLNKLDDEGSTQNADKLNDKELQFLKLACTEMTYKEIADKMNLSPRTIDGYRDALFEKLKLKTRVGLVMYALKNGIAHL